MIIIIIIITAIHLFRFIVRRQAKDLRALLVHALTSAGGEGGG